MEMFYTYVYSNLMILIIAAIGISILSVVVSRKGKFRLARRLAVAGIAADAVIAGIYLTSYIFVQYSNDMLMMLLWGGMGYWNYRRYKGK